MTHSLIEVLLSLLSSYRVLRFTFLVPHVFPRVRSFCFAFSPSTFTSTPASTVSLTATWIRPPLPMYSLHSQLLLQSILFWAIFFSEPFFLGTFFFSHLSNKIDFLKLLLCHLKYGSSCKLHFLIQDPPVHQTSGQKILALVHREVSAHWLELQNSTRLS